MYAPKRKKSPEGSSRNPTATKMVPNIFSSLIIPKMYKIIPTAKIPIPTQKAGANRNQPTNITIIPKFLLMLPIIITIFKSVTRIQFQLIKGLTFLCKSMFE